MIISCVQLNMSSLYRRLFFPTLKNAAYVTFLEPSLSFLTPIELPFLGKLSFLEPGRLAFLILLFPFKLRILDSPTGLSSFPFYNKILIITPSKITSGINLIKKFTIKVTNEKPIHIPQFLIPNPFDY